MQLILTVYCSVYTSLHVFTQPDKGKAVGKVHKHLMYTFIKQGIEINKSSMPSSFIHT